MKWMLMAGAVAAFAAWTYGAYMIGAEAGRDDVEAGKVPALMATIAQAHEKAGELQQALDALGKIGSAVQTKVRAFNTAVDEANRRLADARVMASCPAFTDRDVRLLNAEIDRLQSAPGLPVP